MSTNRRRRPGSQHHVDRLTATTGKRRGGRSVRRLVNVEPLEGRVLLSIVPAATAPPPDQQSPTARVEKASGPATAGDLEFFFTVDYQDNVAVAGQTIDSHDVLVTGPNNFSQIAAYVGDAQPDSPSIQAK